mgnify:FL=1
MKRQIFLLTSFILFMSQNTYAESLFEDKFEDPSKWKFISDNVMGGLSTGSIVYEMTEGQSIAYLSGEVTTENNGGFIQFRRNLKEVNLKEANYVKITAKGNNEKYYIHLRTSGTILPWQYYQSSFLVKETYKEYILPIKEFKKSGSFQANTIKSRNITSIGVVAYGRDHQANIYVKDISFFK